VICFKVLRLEKCVMGVKSNFRLIIYVNLKLGKVEIHTAIFYPCLWCTDAVFFIYRWFSYTR
jgi:hypothetical protein